MGMGIYLMMDFLIQILKEIGKEIRILILMVKPILMPMGKGI